ncbi:hypothetical protein HOE04_00020 [archaeon]|jgi:hypothetical protein|nr:hypothetical protein [archaeon]
MKSLEGIPIRKIEVEGFYTFSSNEELGMDARGYLETMLDAYELGDPMENSPELYKVHRGVMKAVEFEEVGDNTCLVEIVVNSDLNSWRICEYNHPGNEFYAENNLDAPMMSYAALQQGILKVGV